MHAIEIQLTTKDTSIDAAGEPVTISGHGDTFEEAAADLKLELEALFGEWDMEQVFELNADLQTLQDAGADVDRSDLEQPHLGYTLRLIRA